MSTFGASNKLYMILKLNVKGSVPMVRVGHAHSNKDFLYTLAIAKQQGNKADLSSVGCVENQEMILSTLRNQEYSRQMSDYASNGPWLYFVCEVPKQLA